MVTALVALLCLAPTGFAGASERSQQTPILLYHRIAPAVADQMTVSTRSLESQLAIIHAGGYHVIPLRELVDSVLNGGLLPPRSVAITADDGHESLYVELVPRLRQYGFPATFFIYPSAISHAKWAMTWDQLSALEKSGLVDIESHTYWHPNFKLEKGERTAADYKAFVDWQLVHANAVLEKKLAKHIDLLAWPFGIYDDWLLQEATMAGYRAGFTLERRSVQASDRAMALPRYLMTDAQQGIVFERLLAAATGAHR